MSSKSINQLFQTAQDEGNLSVQSMKALNAIDPGAAIQQGFGVNVADVEASEITLINLLIDNSGSIRMSGNSDAVRDGHNGILVALGDSKQKNGILAHCRYLTPEGSSNVLYPYCKLADAKQMDAHNYNPMGSTPLYRESVVILGAVLAKTQEFEDNGVAVRSVTCIVTDGADTDGGATPRDVEALVKDMLKAEKHIICGMGIADGTTDFKAVFKGMGIPDEWILTPSNDPKSIRRAFNTVSQSAVKASQGAASFSKTALGGFGG